MSRNASRLTAGIVIGTLLTATVAVAGRRLEQRAGRHLLDWPTIRTIARRRVGDATGRLSSAERLAAEAFYAAAVERVGPLVAAEIGAQLPHPLDAPAVIDRLAWIDLNLATFQRLIGRVEAELLGARPAPRGAGASLARIVNRSLGNHQLGWLLAFLAGKVLGQYDVSLLATASPTRGRLYVVEANVLSTADSLGIPRDAFRTFIAIHEVTHAYEFEAHPWLRDHFASLVEETLHRLAADAAGLWGRMANARQGNGHWMERLMTPEQREAFGRTQALMSLLEGASNHVMHAVGARILPGFDELHERFEGRHRRRGPLEQVVLRLTGLDLKLEQYAEGERFVAAVMARGGAPAFARVWRGPQWLPTLAEIREPERWLARADALHAQGAGEALP
ncbi:MAG: zinc-dependent metalloprotease [Candidatus Limnocylindria bacterium]